MADPHRTPARRRTAALVAVCLVGALAACSTSSGPSSGPSSAPRAGGTTGGTASAPYRDPHLPVAARVADLLSRMTLAEKVGQMTQAERSDAADDPSLVSTALVGSLLSGGGSAPARNDPTGWADMVDGFQKQALGTRLGIPLLYGVDAVHGFGHLPGATLTPHDVGLGATRDPQLVADVEHVAAAETRAAGPQWVFGPCLCAARDDRWGRTYESFSEDPALVERMETAVDGLQGPPGQLSSPDRVLATAKHYAGDGDTGYDPGRAGSNRYPIDQGVAVTSHADFDRVALRQYAPAVRDHHVGSVMPSFSSVDWTEDGVGDPVKMHANRDLITGHLNQDLGFAGIVVSDWQGIHQLPDVDDPTGSALTAAKVRAGVTAGIDLFMEPGDAPQFERLLTAEVTSGRVPRSRIDDAVRRILTAKFALGLFEHPYTDRSRQAEIGSAAHRAVARQAVAESQVLLKNEGDALPLRPGGSIYVAGRDAADVGAQAGGWSLTWQGGTGVALPGTTILQGIRAAAPQASVTFSADASAPVSGHDVGIVVVGETPYAEGYGDVGGPRWANDPADGGTPRPEQTMTLSAADAAAVGRVCAAVRTCVVSVVSGRPLVIPPALLSTIDALVASWLPGSEGEGVADVLFGTRPFSGRLPVTWPRTLAQEPVNVGDAVYDPLFPYGWGLRTGGTTPAEQALLAATGPAHAVLADRFARAAAAAG